MSTAVRAARWTRLAPVTLGAGGLEATFVPGYGLLGVSLCLDGEEFLSRPGGVGAYRHGHTTGLPLLSPWANRLDGWSYGDVDLRGLPLKTDENGLPIHGTLGAGDAWTVTEQSPSRLVARFEYARPDLLAAFPFPHELETELEVDGERLTVVTTLRPTGDVAVPVCFGYHPYLRLPGGPRARWRLLMPDRHGLELDGRGIPTGRRVELPAEADPIGSRTFDDLFALDGDADFGFEGAGRRLTVSYGEGYRYAQVFAPPGKRFVCLEPMTAPTNALLTGEHPTVEPGGTFTARFAITLG